MFKINFIFRVLTKQTIHSVSCLWLFDIGDVPLTPTFFTEFSLNLTPLPHFLARLIYVCLCDGHGNLSFVMNYLYLIPFQSTYYELSYKTE